MEGAPFALWVVLLGTELDPHVHAVGLAGLQLSHHQQHLPDGREGSREARRTE